MRFESKNILEIDLNVVAVKANSETGTVIFWVF
jgi:hypothetical protein